jgi:hypothetical protein
MKLMGEGASLWSSVIKPLKEDIKQLAGYGQSVELHARPMLRLGSPDVTFCRFRFLLPWKVTRGRGALGLHHCTI